MQGFTQQRVGQVALCVMFDRGLEPRLFPTRGGAFNPFVDDVVAHAEFQDLFQKNFKVIEISLDRSVFLSVPVGFRQRTPEAISDRHKIECLIRRKQEEAPTGKLAWSVKLIRVWPTTRVVSP